MRVTAFFLVIFASNGFAAGLESEEAARVQKLKLEKVELIQERNKISSILTSKLEWSEGEREWMKDRLKNTTIKIDLTEEKQKSLEAEMQNNERKQTHFEQWDVFKNFNK